MQKFSVFTNIKSVLLLQAQNYASPMDLQQKEKREMDFERKKIEVTYLRWSSCSWQTSVERLFLRGARAKIMHRKIQINLGKQ